LDNSLEKKVVRLWKKTDDVARGRVKKAERERVVEQLDHLLDINTCNCIILLCSEPGSDCKDLQECKIKSHVKCNCPLASMVPVMEFQWLASQRAKKCEKSSMMMAGNDKKETERQQKGDKRKVAEEEADQKRKKMDEEEKEMLVKQNKYIDEFMAELDETGEEGDEEEFTPPTYVEKEQEEDVKKLVDTLLEERLGDKSGLVVRYLGRPGSKRNTMLVLSTARASLR
jgi:hypothetical protein